MSLPPAVQMHVDQIVQLLGLQATRPSVLRIGMDDRGIVQLVTPEIAFRRQERHEEKGRQEKVLTRA